ncbi:MAG: HD domain-containing protein [Candidatus Methanoliparum thermophilum]|uniref:HD domain-containing protein n=1 Tax=Methanoliparum thermophilum TaxID=2491083 RepID=A0A520KT67_METT2|nr:HD domain-containing protein [Candidatus Methanoliparum sp. LAM-1]RZN65106.1 MAG: HD domain-containing protein [Candidatus Methanoliparum thermophilum]BDC36001.1 phosphohydrolase [Candidatus Methanoliparum sp. LAM-1]
MKIIRDPIHKNIHVSDTCIRFIDTPEIQRLRRIKQLGLTYLVYPGATHTRFEHSLGVMYLADIFSKDLDEYDQKLLKISALLHDVGHSPYSHDSEEVIKKYTKETHEDVGRILEKETISSVLDDTDLKKSDILDIINRKKPLGKILNGPIDIDKMDYLARDSYYTGVTYGFIDLNRLVQEITFVDNMLVIENKGLQAVESLCVSRFLMSRAVYYHHVSRIAESMLKKALIDLLDSEKADPFVLRDMDDYEIHMLLKNSSGYPKRIIDRIETRNLFKRAIYQDISIFDEKTIYEYKTNREKYEMEIAQSAGIDERYVILDIPEYHKDSFDIPFRIDDEIKSLKDVSSLIRVLDKAEADDWKFGIYTLKEYKDKVKKAAYDILNIHD